MRIGFTGTQLGMSPKQLVAFSKLIQSYNNLGPFEEREFHQGCCIGADNDATEEVNYLDQNWVIVAHPPINTSKVFDYARYSQIIHPPKDYLDRNHDIVDVSDLLIAAPKSAQEELRSGTWATIRYARKLGKRLIILER